MTVESATRITKTICNLCPTRCGIDVHVENGKIVKIEGMPEHPFRQPCVKAQAIIEWVYHPERVTEPMKKVNGKWQQISWDDALDFIADKLRNIKERDGARAFAVHLGFPFIGAPLSKIMQRFCDAYGSPNFTTGSSICYWSRGLAHSLTFNHNISPLSPSYAGTRCNLLWGDNPNESTHLQVFGINNATKNGAKLIVIDPRVTPLARQADIHARIRPGTDSALALGMLNVIIGEGLYDKEFTEAWTYGFDRLAEHVKQYTPEKVAEITWIPADTIRDIARMYATNSPACISQGVALDHCTNGFQTNRALSCLIAICGNFDVPGGNTFTTALNQKELRLNDDISGEIGAAYPLFTRFLEESSSAPITSAILTGKPYPIKALVINGSNPAVTWPETSKVRQALEKLELLVVMDIFMNETAELADVFLPAATFLESTVLKDYAPTSLAAIVMAEQSIEPVGNTWSDSKFWIELARRMGYGELFPWSTDEDLYTTLLEPTDFTVDQFKGKPIIFHHPKEERRYLKEGFHTPSGKVELYSETIAQYGYDPLPTYHEPEESPISKPELVKEYPLILISGPRVRFYIHSQLRNVAAMRKHHPDPLVQLHPDTAENLGITDGDNVKVETARGNVKMKAQITPDILPQVVCIPHGWGGEANANRLTIDGEMDPVTGFPAFKSMLCRVIKA